MCAFCRYLVRQTVNLSPPLTFFPGKKLFTSSFIFREKSKIRTPSSESDLSPSPTLVHPDPSVYNVDVLPWIVVVLRYLLRPASIFHFPNQFLWRHRQSFQSQASFDETQVCFLSLSRKNPWLILWNVKMFMVDESENSMFFVLFRAFVYEGFLTELECDHMVSLVS